MLKYVKKTLFASLVLFLLGIVICSVAFIYAANTGVRLFGNSSLSTVPSYEETFSDIVERDGHAFTNIVIRADVSDVRILPTENESSIHFENPDYSKTTYVIENGTLKIVDTVPFYAFGLSFENGKMNFAGFRNVLTEGLVSKRKKSVTIYINPTDIVKDIDITLGVGNVEVSEASSASLNVSASVGDVLIDNSVINGTSKISLKKGNITISDSSYVFMDAGTTVGNIDISAKGTKTNCECSLGDINIKCERNVSEYSIRAAAERGKIFIGNSICDKKRYDSLIQDADAIWVNTKVGDISFYKTVTDA